jgi:hypothetical protein
MKPYRGFTLHRGRSYQDWRVDFPGRARWGTLAEVRADVDAYLSGTLAPHRRPSWA